MNYKEIITSIHKKDFRPIYFLMGEEPYYIDKVVDCIATSILTNDEKEFNQVVLYGKDTNVGQIIAEAKQYPFGANYRVVLVKEAQHLQQIENLESYIYKPQVSTILVICYKYKSLDKRKKFGKELNQKAIVLESNRLYDNQIPDWIFGYLKEKGYEIEEKACIMLTEFLGNDLSNISNELEKLALVVKKQEKITAAIVEEYVGISKEYNVFEFQQALAERNIVRSYQIANYFAANQKNHPLIMIIGMLFSFFQKIMSYHSLQNKSKDHVAAMLKINPYFVQQYSNAARNYSSVQLFQIFTLLKEYDLKSKGVNNRSVADGELLKELTFRILH